MSLPDMPELKPLLRGVTHAYAFWFAVAGAIVLLLLAPTGAARVAAAIYGVGLCGLFAGSALYHRWRWDPRWRPLLRRIDHSTIFVFIASTYTPIAILVMDGTLRWVVLLVVWSCALAGVIFSVAWITAPRVLAAALYLAMGWIAIVVLPPVADEIGVAPFTLIIVGGAFYTAGAIVYALKRPNPWPETFGFHEIFHAFVILAAGCHFAAMAGWVIPA